MLAPEQPVTDRGQTELAIQRGALFETDDHVAPRVGDTDDSVVEDQAGRAPEVLAARDGFYLATVGETGWPYVQYRGGPQGFVHVLDEQTFAFADVRGNRQYITTGNLVSDDCISAFFMGYPNRIRLKILGRAQVRDTDEALAERLCSVRTDGRVERLVIVTVQGVNWNCRQHITPRYSDAGLAPTLDRMATLTRENHLLERDNQALRARLAAG